jgi:DNA-binding FadR family transcriptional regulator
MTAPVVERVNLSEQVANYIRDAIRRDRLRPGDAVPSEMQVSEELGVSRGIVREAFRSLAAAGLVEVRSGKRPVVRSLDGEALTQLLHHAIVTEQIAPRQVLELRRVIEVGTVEMAAARRTAADLAEIGAAVVQMGAALDDVGQFLVGDLRFHLAIAGATQNPLVAVLVRSLREPIEDSMREVLRRRSAAASIRRYHGFHQTILQALANQDAAQAAAVMAQHFEAALAAIGEAAQQTEHKR